MAGLTRPSAGGITIYRPATAERRRGRRWFAGLLAVALAVGSGAFVNALQARGAHDPGTGSLAATATPFAYFPR
jgi:hypothetical protein